MTEQLHSVVPCGRGNPAHDYRLCRLEANLGKAKSPYPSATIAQWHRNAIQNGGDAVYGVPNGFDGL